MAMFVNPLNTFRMTPLAGDSISHMGRSPRWENWTNRVPSTQANCLERITAAFIGAIVFLFSSIFNAVRWCLRMIHLLPLQSTTSQDFSFGGDPFRTQEVVRPNTDSIAPRGREQQLNCNQLREQITAMRTQLELHGIAMEWTQEALICALLHLDNAGQGDGAPLEAVGTLLRRIHEAPSTQENPRGIFYSLSQILDSCLANREFLETTVVYATEMRTNCSDRVETFLTQIRLQWELQCNPEMGQPANLARLLIGIKRVQLIEQIVRRDYPGREELEVNLYCLVQLKRALALPPSISDRMNHAGCGRRSVQQLERISNEVLRGTREIPDLCRILCLNPRWEALMWGQEVSPLLRELLEELNGFLSIGSDAEGNPYRFSTVLTRIARQLSSEDAQGMLQRLAEGALINGEVSMVCRHARAESARRAIEQTRGWAPLLSSDDETLLSDRELQVCRQLLSTLIVLGYQFHGDLPEEINEGSLLLLLELVKQIREQVVRQATVEFLQGEGHRIVP